jgi:hypothetical protein
MKHETAIALSNINKQLRIMNNKLDEVVELTDRPKKVKWWRNMPKHGVLVRSKQFGCIFTLTDEARYTDDLVPLTNEEIEAFKR